MRVLSFIGVLIVLMQCAAPCADKIVTSFTNAKTELTTATNQQSHSTRDECSPFCQCSCCATHCVTQITFTIPAPFVSNLRSFPNHLPGNFIDVSFSIWQPPQLIA